MSATQIFIPLLVTEVVTFLLWIGLSFIFKDRIKGALMTTAFLILFFSYGHFFDLLKEWLGSIIRHEYMVPVTILLWIVTFYFIKHIKNLKIATQVLNIIGIGLIGINLFNIISYEIKKPKIVFQNIPKGETKPVFAPDIYYIILDEYASLSTIKKVYHYDNTQFANYLIKKGFYIATKSKTRYSATEKSIAASLNMEYLDEKADPYQLIKYNRVFSFLKSKGYKIIHFANYHNSTKHIKYVDLYFNFYEQQEYSFLLGDFYMILLNTTLLKPIYSFFVGRYYEGYNRGAILSTFRSLKKIPALKGPKFVFAHIMCPHEPFVFGPNGEKVKKEYRNDWKNKKVYLGQYIFVTKEVKKLVDVILQKSNSPPIIIIQSDHGPRSRKKRGVYFGDEWQRIFNAYYLPNKGKEILYDSISPVNTFRIIFNHYLNTHYTLLEG